MGKFLKIVCCIFFLPIFFSACSLEQDKKIKTEEIKKEAIKIGLINPLSGELAYIGEDTLNAINLAVEEINKMDGINGRQIELIVEDSPCDPKKAVDAYNKLSNINDVDKLIGPACSSELLAVSSNLNKEEKIAISFSATDADVSDAGDYVFRNVVSDSLKSKVFANYVFNKYGIKEVFIVHGIDSASAGFIGDFSKKFQELGGKIFLTEVVQPETVDFRTIVLKIKNSGVENVLLHAMPVAMGEILNQAKELGLEQNFFAGVEGILDTKMPEVAGENMNGLVYIQPKSSDNEEFIKKYKDKYNETPSFYAAEAYDTVQLFGLAMKDGTDNKKVKENLYKIKDFKGASGNISFDEKGDCIKPFEIIKVVDMKSKILEVIE